MGAFIEGGNTSKRSLSTVMGGSSRSPCLSGVASKDSAAPSIIGTAGWGLSLKLRASIESLSLLSTFLPPFLRRLNNAFIALPFPGDDYAVQDAKRVVQGSEQLRK